MGNDRGRLLPTPSSGEAIYNLGDSELLQDKNLTQSFQSLVSIQ